MQDRRLESLERRLALLERRDRTLRARRSRIPTQQLEIGRGRYETTGIGIGGMWIVHDPTAQIGGLAVSGNGNADGSIAIVTRANQASVLLTLKIEELTGAIDDANVTFTSTYEPLAGAAILPLVVLRHQLFAESSGAFALAGSTWTLAAAPQTTGGFTDMQPIGIYLFDPDGMTEVI